MTADETRAVVERHMDALRVGDIDRVMEDYTDESVSNSINLGGVFKGRAAILAFFQASGSMPGFAETAAYAEGDAYFVTWTADGIELGSDTLVVRNGKIALQTVVVVLASRNRRYVGGGIGAAHPSVVRRGGDNLPMRVRAVLLAVTATALLVDRWPRLPVPRPVRAAPGPFRPWRAWECRSTPSPCPEPAGRRPTPSASTGRSP